MANLPGTNELKPVDQWQCSMGKRWRKGSHRISSQHYTDVIWMPSVSNHQQINCLFISLLGLQQMKHLSSTLLACWDQWTLPTNGQLCRKCVPCQYSHIHRALGTGCNMDHIWKHSDPKQILSLNDLKVPLIQKVKVMLPAAWWQQVGMMDRLMDRVMDRRTWGQDASQGSEDTSHKDMA